METVSQGGGQVTIFTEVLGKTLTAVERHADEKLVFRFDDGTVYKMYHAQSCCESVAIEDIVGDLDDLTGSPLLEAEEVISCPDPSTNPSGESATWTFYKFGTASGSVTIRWYGTSNGYYSESATFRRVR